MRSNWKSIVLTAILLAILVVGGIVWMPDLLSDPPTSKAKSGFASDRSIGIAFDQARSIDYLKQICAIGPRISGTPGMVKQQDLIEQHFTKLGAKVERQKFTGKQVSRPASVEMTNLTVTWFPDRERRLLLCTHYDTRPIADREPDRRRWTQPFVSANDGASGVAWLMELGNHIKTMPINVGVDFVFFDGEEYIFDPEPGKDRYFFGSEHFSAEYVRNRPRHRYMAGVLLDLFAAPNAKYQFEQHSLFQAGAVTREIWSIAKELGETSFEDKLGPDVLDDHIALNRAGIPTTDIIDLEYPHWHMLSDTPDKCSGEQLSRIARVITTWMSRQR